MVGLALHGANTTVLDERPCNSSQHLIHQIQRDTESQEEVYVIKETHSKEDPLQHLAVVLYVTRVKPELLLYVLRLGEIEKDGCALENRETIEAVAWTSGKIDESGYTTQIIRYIYVSVYDVPSERQE